MASGMDNVRNRIRSMMGHDKNSRIIRAAQGQTASTLPNTAYDVLQSYGYDVVADYLRLEQDLTSRFVDYKAMDEYPETSAILNIYADDATQPDTPSNKRLWVTSPHKDVEWLLNDMLHKRLRIEDDIWSIARSTCHMGSDYEEILVGEDGVFGLNNLPAHTVRRVEGMRGELYGFVQDFQSRSGYTPREFQQLVGQRHMGANTSADINAYNGFGGGPGGPMVSDLDQAIPFEDWKVAHFRLRLKERRSLYGASVLEPARWIWKRLQLLEDSALIYRLQRAAERYVFYVNVGSNPGNEGYRLVNMLRQQFKKKKYVNPKTGELDLKYTMIAPPDDLFIPAVNGDPSTRVDVLGSPSWQSMTDIEYFLRKLFSACLVPRAYLSQEEGINRAVLSSEDVRFARTVMRVQRELKMGIEHICRVHLAALGIPPHVVPFEVHFTVPSAIFELAQIEVKNAQADLMARLREHTSLRYVLEHVLGKSEEDINIIFKQRADEAEYAGDMMGRQNKAASKYEPKDGAGGGFGGGGFGGLRSWREGPLAGADLRGLYGHDPAYQAQMLLRQQMLSGKPVLQTLSEEKLSSRQIREMDSKVNLLLQRNQGLANKLSELSGLMQDIRHLSGRRR